MTDIGLTHVAFSVRSRLCADARADGVLRKEPTDSGPPVGYWAFLADPDGNTLEVSYGQEIGLTVAEAPRG
jgi:catechol 2,3-dioxygenase-like lactoylglutathione lyase family enzyme